jgi:uncharacterized protein YbaR (Trm112 family)
MTLDARLLGVLACPKCKGTLQYNEGKDGESLSCNKCRLKYRVEDGIPVMLIDEATPF